MAIINIDWYKPTPSAWEVENSNTEWAELSNPGSLPEGKTWMVSKGAYTTSEIFSKGANCIKHAEAEGLPDEAAIKLSGRTCVDVPRPEAFFGLSASGPDDWQYDSYGILYNKKWYPTGPFTQAQAEAKGSSFDVSNRVWIGESEEGDSWVDANHPMWGWFYGKFVPRAKTYWEALGKIALVCHNYFNIGNPGWMSCQSNLAESQSKANGDVSSMGLGKYSSTGTLRHTTLVMEGVYLNEPDSANRNVLRALFKQLVYKKAGYYVGFYLFGVYEWRPNSFGVTYYKQKDFPSNWGEFYRHTKIPLPAEKMMAYAALGLLYLDMVTEWGGQGKTIYTNIDTGWGGLDLWFKEGSTSPTSNYYYSPSMSYLANDFNRYQFSGPERKYPGPGSNNFAFGVGMYKDTFGTTHGAARVYPRYRLDSGGWVSQTGSEFDVISRASYLQLPLVMLQKNAGKTSLMYYLEDGPPIKQHLEVEDPSDPSKIYSGYVCGGSLYMKTITE